MFMTAIAENAKVKGFTTYHREQRQRVMVDCAKGMHAKQQPTKFSVASQE
jgi:hypothetical protein